MDLLVLTCYDCEKSFKSRNNLQCHISAVHRVILSLCNECGREFKNPDYLRNHVNRFHNTEIVICDVCKKVCKSKANLYNHKKDVHELVKNLLCSLCGEAQKNYSYLGRHKRRFCKYKGDKTLEKNTKVIVRKSVPDTFFETDIPLQNHLKNKANESDSSAEKNNSNKSLNASDVDIANSENRIGQYNDKNWDFCDLENTDGFHLIDAQLNIAITKTRGCLEFEKEKDSMEFTETEVGIKENTNYVINRLEECNTFEEKCDIINESKIQDGKSPKEEPCDDLDAEITEKMDVVKLAKKKLLKPKADLKCKVCLKIFRKSSCLSQHVEDNHMENIKTIPCDICSKQYRRLDLIRHMKNVHTQEDSSCDECGKTYNNKKHLKDHIRAVHQTLDLLCHLCSKTFKCKSYLSNHVRRFHNSLDEVHICEYCSKVFKSQNQIYLHNKAVHTVENLPCLECGKIYRNSYLLNKHIKHKHSG